MTATEQRLAHLQAEGPATGGQRAEMPGPTCQDLEDLLSGASWSCTSTPPGAFGEPARLPAGLRWLPAQVPGTAAGALRDAGLFAIGDERDCDEEDWWFSCELPAGGEGPNVLVLAGVATLADVWLDGRHLLSGTSMFVRHEVPLGEVRAGSQLVLRCAALSPALARRGAPARWRSGLVARQGLRQWRTSFIGRVPVWPSTGAPVGPWRRVSIERRSPGRLLGHRLSATMEGETGRLELTARVQAGGPHSASAAVLRCAGAEAPVSCSARGDEVELRASLELPAVRRWWPRPYGEAALHGVELVLGDGSRRLGRVGFRQLALDRSGGGFTLSCNGVALFCRGVCWWPPDPVSLAAPPATTRRWLEEIASTGFNVVRVTGWTTYPDEVFYEVCDELGLLVWQDLMFGTLDVPNITGFADLVREEAEQLLGDLGAHPSLGVVCGSNEGESQPAMLGLRPEHHRIDVVESVLPGVAARLVPGVPLVPSVPSGGPMPFFPGEGPSHYFGVGGHRRPLSDARLAGVRFAAECLALAAPPERGSTDRLSGAVHAVRDARWLAATPRDAGASWDFGDVTDHYLTELFGLDALHARAADPERYLALQRATCAVVVDRVLSEWRRPGSSCAGALLENWRDVVLGPGFGLLDSLGVPKSTWYAAHRVLRPLGCLVTDEGLNGLWLHCCNDLPRRAELSVVLGRYAEGERMLESGSAQLVIEGHSSAVVCLDTLLPGFRDLTCAYGFAPPEHDVIGVTVAEEGRVVASLAYLPGGLGRPVEADIGLSAEIRPEAPGRWSLEIATRRFAQLVEIDAAGLRIEDSWFDMLPGAHRRILLTFEGGGMPPARQRTPRVLVRALNSSRPAVATARAVPPVEREPAPGTHEETDTAPGRGATSWPG